MILDDVLAINKPYGMPMFESGSTSFQDRHTIEAFLPFLAKGVGASELYQVRNIFQIVSITYILN